MPRQARLDAPGTLHHVMIRGIEGANLFRKEGKGDVKKRWWRRWSKRNNSDDQNVLLKGYFFYFYSGNFFKIPEVQSDD